MTKSTKEETPVVKRRMTARQWTEAETLYALDEASIIMIAKKYDVSKQTVFQHMQRAGVKRGSKAAEHAKKVADAVVTGIVGDAGILASRIRETKEDHYKMAAGLAKLTWAEILKTKNDGVPVSAAINNLKALDSAMSVLKKAREERYSVLGLDRTDFVDEESLPELVISELNVEQIAMLQSRDDDFEELQNDVVETSDDDESEE